MAHVAAEFPQLCEAETRAFARLLGTHVQRLATIAHGDGVCTTHIPGTPGTSGTPGSPGGREHDLDPGRSRSSSSARYEFGWADSDAAGAAAKRGLSEDVVRDISAKKTEPEWMLDLRLKGLRLFDRKPMPTWGADLSGIDFDNIKYFVRSTEKQATTWDELPDDIKNTYDRLGIPEAEKQRLVAGVAAQYESEVVYHKIREDLEEQGVIFLDTDTGLREHPELFKEYFGSVIPVGDNKFAALNTAVWSGGSFIYVPPGVHVEIPLQAYFRINTENMGQFERTLIIVDEGAYVHYVEGCTAPIYSSDSLHSAVVEIIVKKGARCRYTTIQNWSNNVYNLVTKRAVAHEGATMEWIDGNIGSKVTMKYPAVWMIGEHAKGETLSIAFAGEGQHQDAGAKMVHAAPQHVLDDHLQVGRPRRRPHLVPRAGAGPRGRAPLPVDGEVRRAAGRRDQPLGHLPVRRRPRGRRVDGPRGDRVQGQRGPAVLPDEPRPDRGRGDGDDRARLRRADRPRAADGVRARAQPADRAADGRGRRLMQSTRHGRPASRAQDDRWRPGPAGAARRSGGRPAGRRRPVTDGPGRRPTAPDAGRGRARRAGRGAVRARGGRAGRPAAHARRRATAVPPGASTAGGHSHGPGDRPRAERFTSTQPGRLRGADRPRGGLAVHPAEPAARPARAVDADRAS